MCSSDLINDVLDLSKIEAGKYEIVPVSYHIGKLIYDIIQLTEVQLLGKPIHLVAEIEPAMPSELLGDDIRIRQILTNLLSNAMKFTKSGEIRVYVSGERTGADQIDLKISVSDTGIGIREEDRDKLFQVFSQVDTRKNRQIYGSGLGLAISQNLGNLMGGQIEVESEYGSGTTFTFHVVQRILNDVRIVETEKQSDRQLVLVGVEEPYRSVYDNILMQAMISHHFVDTIKMVKEIREEQIDYVILPCKAYEENKDTINSYVSWEKVVLLTECARKMQPDEMRFKHIRRPLFGLQIEYLMKTGKVMVDIEENTFDKSTITPLPFTKVLVVDDSVTNQRVACGLMKPYQMEIDTASSGQEAIDT